MKQSRSVVTSVALAALSVVVYSFAKPSAASVQVQLSDGSAHFFDASPRLRTDPVATGKKASSQASTFPLIFAENRGQFPSDARYSARYRGINAFVTDVGFRFGLWSPEAIRFEPRSEDPFGGRSTAKAANVFFTFEGSSADVKVEGLSPLPTKFNYFLGSEPEGWRTDVPTFSGVRQHGMYDNVDVVIGDREGRLEYDVHVRPGGDLASVIVRVDGADLLRLNDDGTLLAETAAGPFIQTAPVAFSKNPDGTTTPVACRFRMIDDVRFGFEADACEEGAELVVDPGLIYAYMISGSLADQAYAAGGDAALNNYVGGRTASSNFPAVPGSFDVTLTTGNFDGFVAKINTATGALAYATFIGGSGMDYVYSIEVDAFGFLYAAGQAGSTSFPTTAGAYDTSYNGQGDGFALKLNQAGSALIYSTLVGGSFEDRVHAMAVDPGGSVYIAGQTLSHFTYPGYATQTIPTGANFSTGAVNWNVSVTKINPSGTSLGWSFRTGGNANDWAYGISVDPTGACYVVGGTNSNTFPTVAAYDATPNGGYDAFLFKTTPTASALVYSTYIGGSGNDQAFAVTTDATGAAYVGGNAGIGFPTTPGAWDLTGDGSDGFVTKFTPSGNSLTWSTYLGGSSSDQVQAIRVDQGIRPIVAGWTSSANFPTTPSGYDTTYGGGGSPAEGFLVKLTWDGTALLYGTFIGGDGNEEISAIALDVSGWAYVAGITMGSSAGSFLPCTIFPGGSCGAEEGFTAKFELPASPSATVVGQGCRYVAPGNPFPPPPPSLTSTLPTLGQALTFSGSDAAPLNFGSLILSNVPSYGLPISAECTIYFDLLTAIPFLSYATGATGNWGAALFLANDPAWVGAVFRVQGVAFSALSPWGFELTNGLDCEIGY